ncbi:MAG: hypothetical protein ICV51_12705 [Flavisolibacter sp.]|nr:hypothetical protein [Flavisolibacter sp.]
MEPVLTIKKEVLKRKNSSTSMKMKMFIDKDPLIVEAGVNEWLQQHDVHIKHITQSQSEKNGKFVFVISLYYYTESD